MKPKIQAEKVRLAYGKFGKNLNDKEREIIIRFYGIDKNVRHSLRELGEMFEVTRERIRQIKSEALIKLKIKNLKDEK